MSTDEINTSINLDMKMSEAGPRWLRTRKVFMAQLTYVRAEKYLRRVIGFFGALPLREITADHIRTYQEGRLQEAGADCINHEISQVKQILTRVGAWHAIEDDYQRLPQRASEIGQVLTEEEKSRLIEAARSRPAWRVAYLATVLSANTTLGPKEIRHLRLGDLDIDNRLIWIRRGKTAFRQRNVPLNDDAAAAAKLLLERAKLLGATDAEHFLLPFRSGTRGATWDPSQPVKGWRSAWRSLTRVAGLSGKRFYDLRHHAITELDEHNISSRTIKAIAGHSLSSRLIEHYSHPRLEARRRAVELINFPCLEPQDSGVSAQQQKQARAMLENQAPEPRTGTWAFWRPL